MFNGFNRGLQLIGQFILMFAFAAESGNLPMLNDLVPVAKQWLSELTKTGWLVLNWKNPVNVAVSIWNFVGGDPFKTSRQMFEAVQAKYQ